MTLVVTSRARGAHIPPRRCVCAVVACVGLLVLASGVGTASAARWVRQQVPPVPHGDLSSVACPSTSACVAVGSSYVTDPQSPRPYVVRWTGTAWRAQHVFKALPSGRFTGVACSSARTCVAVGYTTDVNKDNAPLSALWNGARWVVRHVPEPRATDPPPVRDPVTLNAVTCHSPSDCVAVGSEDGTFAPIAERWNGRSWRIEPSAGVGFTSSSGYLTAVSCPSAGTCVASGESEPDCARPLIERGVRGHWTQQHAAAPPGCLGNAELSGLFCRSPSACAAVGLLAHSAVAYVQPLAEQEVAGRWRLLTPPVLSSFIDPWGGEAHLAGISCPSRTTCLAVGSAGSELRDVPILERRQRGIWTAQRVDGHILDGFLTSISCTSSTRCTAVGSDDSRAQNADFPLVERLQ